MDGVTLSAIILALVAAFVAAQIAQRFGPLAKG